MWFSFSVSKHHWAQQRLPCLKAAMKRNEYTENGGTRAVRTKLAFKLVFENSIEKAK